MNRTTTQRIVDALNNDPEMQALNADEERGCEPGAMLAAVGVDYELHGRPVSPPTVLQLAALSLIDSPLLDEAEDIGTMDCWRALWAVTADTDTLRPLLGLAGRIRTLEKMRGRGVSDEALSAAIDRAAEKAWSAVDRDVLKTAARYPGATAQEIADVVQAMLGDCAEAWSLLPKKRGAAQKKTTLWTAIGWRRCTSWLRGLAYRWIRLRLGTLRPR